LIQINASSAGFGHQDISRFHHPTGHGYENLDVVRHSAGHGDGNWRGCGRVDLWHSVNPIWWWVDLPILLTTTRAGRWHEGWSRHAV
jgi:hypothetical protein